MPDKKKILVVSFQSLTARSGAGMARLGYYLSEELHKRGLLKNFIVYSKGKFTTSFPSSAVSKLSRYYLYALNKMNKFIPMQPHKFRFLQEKLFDWCCVRRINNDIDILFVTQPYLRRTFQKAKKLGIKVIFIPANPEENYINNIVSQEKKKLHIEEDDAYTYEKRINYYNASMKYVDIVVGSYPTVYDSYARSAYQGQVVKLIGHLKPDFSPAAPIDRPIKPEFKVGYLAHTVILKGLQYLFDAWEMVMKETDNDENLKLYVAGGIDESMHEHIVKNHLNIKNVQLIGRIADVPEFMKDKDLFIVPSLVDGGPYTALEAAHYCLPVIITSNAGSSELLSRGDPGCHIIPIRDARAIKNEILWAYTHREEAKQMGLNAKHNLDNYKMEAFISELGDYLENL